jgi:lipopolysaccharide biosynthesis regulator YciM
MPKAGAAEAAKEAGVKEVQQFFNSPGVTGEQRDMGLADMKREWLELALVDRKEIQRGIGDGSLTYPQRQREAA